MKRLFRPTDMGFSGQGAPPTFPSPRDNTLPLPGKVAMWVFIAAALYSLAG